MKRNPTTEHCLQGLPWWAWKVPKRRRGLLPTSHLWDHKLLMDSLQPSSVKLSSDALENPDNQQNLTNQLIFL